MTTEQLETLRKIHEMMDTLPEAGLAAVAKHALDSLPMPSGAVPYAILDAMTDKDPMI